MRLAVVRWVLPLLLLLSGCDQGWRSQFPKGAKLYEQTGHRYFGKVIDFDGKHDFHNGMGAEPSVLIELAGEGKETLWGACATCAATFQIEKPGK